MITNGAQRWRDRRGSYRPAGEVIDTRAYDVAPIADDTTARAFVIAHHYAATYPAARRRLGLYRRGELVGVAVFSQPVNSITLDVLPCGRDGGVELGRLVLLDEVPGNGETWFLGRCFEALRADSFAGVVSFSDPFERFDAIGNSVFGGHVGTIYQAHNAVYLGQAAANTLKLLPSGSVLSARAISKLRAGERGWRYVVGQLVDAGATPFVDGEDRLAWMRREMPRVTRTVRHCGNHKYAWNLDPRTRRKMPKSLPYPKMDVSRQTAFAKVAA